MLPGSDTCNQPATIAEREKCNVLYLYNAVIFIPAAEMVLNKFLKIFTVRSPLRAKWPREILHFNDAEGHSIGYYLCK
jgi:hypothetical protein